MFGHQLYYLRLFGRRTVQIKFFSVYLSANRWLADNMIQAPKAVPLSI